MNELNPKGKPGADAAFAGASCYAVCNPKSTNYLDAPPENVLELPSVSQMPAKSQLRRLIEKYGLKCFWCHRICNPDAKFNSDSYPTREHMTRRADGGSSRMSNLRLACRKCNSSRHHWTPDTTQAAGRRHNSVLGQTDG